MGLSCLPLSSAARALKGHTVTLEGATPFTTSETVRIHQPVSARELIRAWSDARHGFGPNTVASPWNIHRHVMMLVEIATGEIQFAVLVGWSHLHIIDSGAYFIDLRDPEDVQRIRRYALPHPIPPGRNGRVALTHPGHTLP